MTALLASSHVETLRTSLLRLDPTGDDGFEGLMATVLTEITGIPFRVAASGSQFGSDGSSVREEDGVCFECKRYEGTIPRRDIQSKLAELPLRSSHVEAWFLCATSPVKDQLARDIQEIGRRQGITTFILDWTGTLPPLAVAVATARDAARRFLPPDTSHSVAAALDAIRASAGFEASAEQLSRSLLEPLVGTAVARRANAAWLLQAFASRRQATLAFGEPLSPLDATDGVARLRANLVARVGPFLTGDAAGTTLCVVGDEGAGKSWLIAQSWARVDRRPLMVVLSPRDGQDVAGPDDCERLLASSIPAQSGGAANETVVSGWRRKLVRWRDLDQPDRPRLIVVLDGVNQRPQTDWARVIGVFDDTLKRLGGRLIVTARTVYYETRLKRRLMVAVEELEELEVLEWTVGERNEILAAHGIRYAGLHGDHDSDATVGRALLNPRLLGIAVRLLKGKAIEHIEELNVSHLLFEHLRTRELESRDPEPAQECVRRLRILARQVLNRLQGGTIDDVVIFDVEDLRIVADGRYFVPVDGDATRYALQIDGLVLAFGFLVLDRLRTAQSNRRNLAAELAVAVDPVASLDQTAAVLMAALTCACIDDTQSDEVVVALLRAFAELQNPNQDDLEAFKWLARRRTRAFLDAARHLCLAGWNQPNVDWIEGALMSLMPPLSTDGEASGGIQAAISIWLGCHAASPEIGGDSHPKLGAEELAKHKEDRDKKLASLSPAEMRLLDGMEETAGDIGALYRLAFRLMAGRRIESLAPAIVRWTLANRIYTHRRRLHEEAQYPVRLNRRDWRAARAALLRESSVFRRPDATKLGTCALVGLLRMTGDPEDAREADELAARISDSKPMRGRLIEQYCSTDPCDPLAPKPSNVSDTARRYDTVDVQGLYSGSWKGSGEHFLEMARPGVARFEPQAAVEKHRQLLGDVLKRRGLSLSRGLSVSLPHSALLTSDMAIALTSAGEYWRREIGELRERDRWWVSQELLFLAFPRLSGEEQLKALLGTTVGDDVLRSLLKVMKPVDEDIFDQYFETACMENDSRRQYFLLAFAEGTGIHMRARSRSRLASLVTSENGSVRMVVFARILHLEDELLMKRVVDSGWCAMDTKERNIYENAYGSAMLVEGALHKWISVDEALARMSPEHCGWAARRLGPVAGRKVAGMVEASIETALSLTMEHEVPDVEYDCRPGDRVESSPRSIGRAALESDDVAEVVKGRTDRGEAFEQRQKRRQEAFETFGRRMRDAGAWIVLEDIALDEFEAIASADGAAAERWCRLFLEAGESGRRNLHNVVLKLAYALRERYPGRAVALLRSVAGGRPPIRHTVGGARVPLEAMVAWSTAGSEQGREWCRERLDLARNDHEIATEVLAALTERQDSALGEFIRERLDRGEPEGIARGLLVAGFSGQCSERERVLSEYEGAKGFIGEAHKAARYAYERDGWARHWFERMCEADQDGDFWRYSVLFGKIVDGRFALWGGEYERTGEPMRLFEWSVKDEIDRRIRKWEKKRGETLFGARKPPEAFLPGIAGTPGDKAGRRAS